ncbi:MAG TPA: DNRLRE domain-containing protein [Solirubrobacteraceae bacterium]
MRHHCPSSLVRPTAILVVLVALVVSAVLPGIGSARTHRASAHLSAAQVRATAATARGLAASRRTRREIVALRTRTSKTYVDSRGHQFAEIALGSLHYRDARGRWANIDSRLVKTDGRLRNRANSYSTSLPLDIGADTVRVRKGRRWVAFRLLGAHGHVHTVGNLAQYPGALDGVDVAYRPHNDSVKESLTLHSREAQRRFVFDLDMAAGLHPDLLSSRALVLRDSHGAPRLSIAAPFVIDRKGARRGVDVRVTRAAGHWRLTYRLPDQWLDAPGRAWPVVVDPGVNPNPDTDCTLDGGQPTTSYCGDATLQVGTVGTAVRQAALRFDLSSIPRGAEVQGATLEMKLTALTGTADTRMDMYPLTQEWTAGATWNSNDGTTRWAEPGGEADTTTAIEYPTGMGSAPGMRYWTFFSLARDWASGRRANHGILLKAADGLNAATFASADDPSSANRPLLHVEYSERMGEVRGHVYERQRLSDRIGLGVNVANGNLRLDQTDFSMPGGLGPAVSFARSFNSADPTTTSGTGAGWDTTLGQDLNLAQQAGSNYMEMRDATGANFTYTRNADGTYATPPGRNDKLVKSGTEWVLTDNASQTKRVFADNSQSGRIKYIEDRNGRRVTFNYTTAGSNNVTSISDSNNDATPDNADDVRFTYANGRISQMTDPAGRVSTYTYDTNNHLTSYADAENGTSFPTTFEYNGPSGRMSKITTPGGRITLITYYPVGDDNAGRVETVTRVTDATTMTGATWEFDYRIRRDGSGETEVTDPIGKNSTDANDRITRYVYDDLERVTTTVDALGHQTSRKLTTNSNVQSYTAASSNGSTPNTSITYDSDDNGKSSDTPVGAGTIRSCADFGAVDGQPCDTAPTGYAGVPSGIAGSKYLPGRATNAEGGRTDFSWQDTGATDLNGNPYSVRQTTNGGTLVAGVSMSYAPTTSSVDGKKGQLSGITDPRGNATSYGYDSKGNVNLVTPPNPGAPNPTGPTRITYNQSLARVDVVQDGKDNYRKLFYDNLDRLTKIEFTGADQVLGSTEPYVQYTYDRDGNQTQEDTRPAGATTAQTRSMTYDKLNRVTFESLPGGLSNTYTYDLIGNLRSLTDAGGKVEYAYDALNQIRAVYEPGVAKPTKFVHSQDGLRTKTSYPNGVTIDEAYDAAFRPTQIHARNASSATLEKFDYTYLDPSTSRETPMIFTKADGPLGQTTTYSYDGLDRLDTATIKATSTGTTLAGYDYNLDAAGNILKRTVSGSQAPNSITDYGYNSSNELCATAAGTSTSVPPACPTTSPAFTYDKNGNELTAPGRSSVWDLADRATSIGGIGMTYLGAGQARRTGENTGTLQHNVLGVGYDNVDGATHYFTRDDMGQILSRRDAATRVYYVSDALGSVVGQTDPSGNLISRKDYDPYGAPAPSGAGQWAAGPVAGLVSPGQFGFAGGLKSTSELYQFGQRYYDRSLMRWTQPDPLDQTGDLREGNRYLYAGADPVNNSDPEGQRLAMGGSLSQVCGETATEFVNKLGGGARHFIELKCHVAPWNKTQREVVNCVVGGAIGLKVWVIGAGTFVWCSKNALEDAF